ncbi:MAG: DNA polymerase III subunit beta [Candidatus Zambryskibacteria bacterium CG_4_9_14_3_um_filter_40_16]|uniref:Beta sliding clamp n=2 Tax=Candidatus Zambryskiibacteriota TaxID=1817925 RepID=A0A2H0K736_9BACT|nr:MAG: DNA polymerase III subunit beta [Candidatus Zambryskibacteria bacterium CG11_big_fil_rev_8_21_14_0_20_40_24]PJA33436.1 MAG: DNA polymerase III subunit beta [Candidatus Zambryskibacteria bacterium CG_4_9_14_3_um_filter_40_16]
MKLECTKEKLISAISKAEKITSKNMSLPVLGCILFVAENNNLIIKSTNLDIGIEINIPVKVKEPGTVAVPGGVFLGLLSNIQGDTNIILEEDKGNLRISSKNTTSLVKAVVSDDFPSLPKLSGEKEISVKSQDILNGFKSVWYAAATVGIKPELSSVLVFSDGEDLVFAATDSFRLAEKKVYTKRKLEIPPTLIPFKNVSEIIRVLESSEKEISIRIDHSQIAFLYNGVYLVSRTIEGNFPDYKQVIPKETKTEVITLKQDLIQALKIANIFSDQFNQISLNISPKKNFFEIKTKNANIGENSNKLEAVLKGEETNINFNYKYIVDSFQSIDSDSVIFSFGGASQPLIIKGVSDSSFLYLVMPMNK